MGNCMVGGRDAVLVDERDTAGVSGIAGAEAHGRGDAVFVGELGQGLVGAEAEDAGDLQSLPGGWVRAVCSAAVASARAFARVTAFLARSSSRCFSFKPAERKRLRH